MSDLEQLEGRAGMLRQGNVNNVIISKQRTLLADIQK